MAGYSFRRLRNPSGWSALRALRNQLGRWQFLLGFLKKGGLRL